MNAPLLLSPDQALAALVNEAHSLLVRLGCVECRVEGLDADLDSASRMQQILRRIENLVLAERAAQKIAEEALRQSAAQAKRLAEVAARTHNAVVITDPCGKIEWVNDAFVGVTGYRLDEVLGKAPGSFLQGPETDQATVASIRESLAARRGFQCDIVNYSKAGRKYWLSIDCQPVFDAHGQVTSFIAIESDVTDKKNAAVELQAAKEAAESANRSKSMFLANMSHEIRTPMNGVVGMTELLLATVLTRTQRRYVHNIQSSSEALLKIINDILDLSKIEAGRLEVETVSFDLYALIKDVRELLAPRAMQKELKLLVWMHPEVPAVATGDPVRLRQILMNLVGNAVKFTEQGEVSVFVELLGEDPSRRLRFAVRDTGIGIAKDVREKLFESFSQADASTTRRFGGTGLGLAISRKLVELMQGEIGVDSELGKGATFWFEVPTALLSTDHTALLGSANALDHGSMEDVDQGQGGDSATALARRGLRVLLVEDHEVNQEIGRAMLETLGHEVTVAEHGAQALQTLGESRFDVVLMDCQMPEMDGFTATRVWRDIEARDNTSHTPIIALTANALQGDRERCLNAGMDDYLSKPFRQAELEAVLHRCLRQFELQSGESAPSDELELSSVVSAVLDADALDALHSLDIDGSGKLLARILDKFLQTGPNMLGDASQAAHARDVDALGKAAHALKSPSGNIGARVLAQIARDVETHARSNNLDGALACMGKLNDAYRDTEVATRELLKTLRVKT